jgi:TP901 family phage tail tape measure protein
MPVIDFSVEAGNAFAVLQKFATQVGLGTLALDHMATNFTKMNSKTGEFETSISGVTATNQKLTASLKQTAAGIELVNLKLQETPKAAAAARKATAAALRITDARTARGALESTFSTSGLSREQADSMRSRISQITSAIERGNVTLAQFQNAAAASTGAVATSSLTETEQKILNIIRRIDTAQDKAATKAREALAKQKTTGTNEAAGAGVVQNLYSKNLSQIDRLGVDSQARVRRQLEQLQGLFSKGLDLAGYNRALKALETGTIGTLTKIESEARHRLERINAELSKAGKGGFLSKIFGGDGGGGLVGAGGGANRVIGGLLLAQGVDNAAESLKAAATSTADFEKQIALLRTLTQDTKGTFDQWQDSILRVSSAVGKSKEEIASAGYDLLSNQITKGVSDTEVALGKAARFATATNSTVIDSVNLLSSVINSFGLDTGHTDEILGKLFTTIDLGRIKASDLANTFGRPGVAAKSLGITFDELDAAMITISQTGLGVEQTNTLITNVLHKLLNPTKELQEHYDELGVSTGEMYVKQFGLVGVLEDLLKTTGGSTAELSKFFNEIRGEQGIVQLTSRLEVFKDALAKLKKNETYGKAIEITTEVPGQRFFAEMQKYSNTWIKFKEFALESILYVTGAVGGLSNALVTASYLAVGLGTGLAGLYGLHIFAKMSGETSVFLQLVGKLGPAMAGAVAIGTGIGIGIGAVIADFDNAKHAAEILAQEGEELAKTQAETVEKSNLRMASANEAALKKMQTNALDYVSKVKKALANLADGQKTAFKAVADELKDSFELVGQALKRVITSGEERERQLVESIAKRKERLRDTHDKSRDDLYDARMVTNRVRVGLGAPDQEGRIQLARIGELRREAEKLAKSSDPQNHERALQLIEKAQGIAQERRTATRQVPIFDGGEQVGTVEILKYADGNRVANNLIRVRKTLIRDSNEEETKSLEVQRKKNEASRLEAKKLQDRANDVVSFKLFNEKGELNYASPEKAIEERERRIKAYQDQATSVAGGQNVTPEAALAVAKTLQDTRSQSDEQLARYRQMNDAQVETYRNQEAAQKKGEEVTKTFDAQVAKIRDLRKEMDDAAREQERYKQAALATLGALETSASRGVLGSIGKIFSTVTSSEVSTKNVDFADTVPKPVQDLLKSAKGSVEQGDIPGALALVDQANAKLKELDATEETLLDKNGKVSTTGQFLKDLRVELSLLMNANDRFRSAGIVSENQVSQAGNMVQMLETFAGTYTSVATAAERFATVAPESFKIVNSEANQMVSSLATALRQLHELTSVAGNMRGVSASIAQGVVNPSLNARAKEYTEVGPPKPGSERRRRSSSVGSSPTSPRVGSCTTS